MRKFGGSIAIGGILLLLISLFHYQYRLRYIFGYKSAERSHEMKLKRETINVTLTECGSILFLVGGILFVAGRKAK